jgi:hypothetical protein
MTALEKISSLASSNEGACDKGFEKNVMPPKLKKFLTENHECYVLITCGRPSKEGKMNVEMTYEGDALLASYLVESASGLLDEQQSLSFC